MIKKLFSHTAIYGLAPQIPKVASFLALPIITRELTDVDYGVYGMIMAYTTAFSVLSILGLRLVLINSFYHSPNQHKWLWRQIYGFLNIWNVVFGIIMGAVLYFIIPDEAIADRWPIVLLNIGPIVFFGQTATIGLTYYQLKQKPLQIAIRTSLLGFLTVGLNIYFIYFLKMGYMGWFWSLFIAGILNNISYWYPLNIKLKLTPIYNFKWRLIKKSLKVSLPMIPHHYSNYLLDSSDKVVMDLQHVSMSNIGKYNVAYSIGNLFSSLSNAVGNALSPLMNERYKAKDDTGARILVFLLQIGFLYLTFISSIWMKEIFNLMIKNETLSEVYPLAIIIAMAYNYRPIYLGVVSKLFYLEKTTFLWKLTFTAGLINIILNFICIPVFGYEAAAYTTFISLMYMGFSGFYYKSFKKVNTINYYPLLWLFTIVALTTISYVVVEFSMINKILISLLYSILTILSMFVLIKKTN